jgi:DNA-directed RNA polymerase subunit RPC12/RpoP
VIRFKCIYCGQRILAPDDEAGKKGNCPTCKHEVYVPSPPKKQPPLSMDQREKMAEAELTLLNIATDSSEDAAELIREKGGWFIPVYDELSLFLMAATLILLYVLNTTMREQINNWITSHNDSWVYIFGVIFLCGLYLSVYHVFTTREKTDVEKWGMLIFAVLTNAISGIVAGLYVLKNDNVRDWQLVFPIWNIINGALLLLMLRFKIIDEECISNRNANTTEVITGLVAALFILILCNYVFKLYWAITFSICIVYTTSFDRALQSVFPGLTVRENEQS